jgi:hypothetical protein
VISYHLEIPLTWILILNFSFSLDHLPFTSLWLCSLGVTTITGMDESVNEHREYLLNVRVWRLISKLLFSAGSTVERSRDSASYPRILLALSNDIRRVGMVLEICACSNINGLRAWRLAWRRVCEGRGNPRETRVYSLL